MSSSTSQWHAINPSTRPLSLSILELTPLALTLALSLARTRKPQTTRRHRRAESDDETAVDDDESAGDVGNFRDLLSHGVVVSVNGQPWSRIVAHVSDEEVEEDIEDESDTEVGGVTRRRPRRARFISSAQQATGRKKSKESNGKDRAVVVVYGLTPGKEYEIELRVVGFDSLVSNSVLIPPSPSRSRANSLRSRSRPRSRANSNVEPPAEAPSQIGQMRHAIATAVGEKDRLSTQIKEARRTSQRAEAALRQEIDSVKRAIEKAGSLDMRAKQKTLALQEQVKQGWAGAEAAEAESNAVTGGMSDLEARLEAAQVNVEEAKTDLKLCKDKEEEVRERDRKARAEEDKKLGEIISKLEKLKAKKDKKEAERAELESKLSDLEKQREDAEKRNETERKRLTSHASMNNLSHGYRQRFQPRYASTGSRPTGSSPSYRPPKPRTFNPNAPYFEPHTSLMPPQLQHRIYPPAVRPRPALTFHPPPSVMEQREAAKQSPTMLSAPAFPPLPGQISANSSKTPAGGPSLASIVTRAVLSPTSAALAPQGITAAPRSPTNPTPPRVSFAPSPNNPSEEFPPLSPTGPWSALSVPPSRRSTE